MMSSLYTQWRNVSPFTELYNWEKDFASKTNLSISRIRSVLLGINLLYILMVVNNQSLVGYKILEFLSVQELAIVSIFIPHISTSSVFLHKIIKNSHIQLNPFRLARCLYNKTLFDEIQHFRQIKCTQRISTLHFVSYNIYRVVFNPIYPIIALIHKRLQVLFIFDYKCSKIVHHFPLLTSPVGSIIAWSPNGCNLSLIIDNEIKLYSFNHTQSIIEHINTFKIITNSLHESQIEKPLDYNWTPNNEMYILLNKQPTFGKILSSLKMHKIEKIAYPKSNWFFVQFLNNKLYFASQCECLKHSVIYEGDKKKIIIPGNIRQFKANEDLLVFLFCGSHFPIRFDTDDNVFCTQQYSKYFLTIGIYDSNENALRQINVR